jgi:long-chain fatty acid transport protein
MTLLKPLLLAAAAVGFVGLSTSAAAAGFYVQEQSARGLGRAYSGEVTDTGAASLWWNPAAIASVDNGEVYSGFHAVDVHANVINQGSTITRPGQPTSVVGGAGLQRDPVETGYVPNLAVAKRLNDRVVVGFAITAPYDFTTKYGTDSWTRYEALTSRLLTLDFQPTVAFHATSWLDVGVGLDLEYTHARLTNALPNLSPLLPDANQELKGDGWNVGWNIGAQARPNDRITLAASFRSSVHHDLAGHVSVSGLVGPLAGSNFSANGDASFSTPWIATFGARYKATDRLALMVQVQRFGWSEFSAIDVNFGGADHITPERYNDTTSVAFGAEYAVSPKLTVRGGIQHDPTPTPDVGRSARVPDGDRWLYALGLTYQRSPRMSLDAGVSYIQFSDSHVGADATAFAGTPAVTPISLDGLVTGNAVVFSVGVRKTF